MVHVQSLAKASESPLDRLGMADQHLVYQQLRHKLRIHLDELLHTNGATSPSRSRIDREALSKELHMALNAAVRAYPHQPIVVSEAEQEQLIGEVIDEMIGLGPLDGLLADPTISEIMVNGPHEIFVEREGCVEHEAAAFRDAEHLMSVIERLLGNLNLSVNEASPICDASLPDGTRINVIIPPLVLNGPVLTIRRKLRDWTVEQYVERGALSPPVAQFLEACVRAKVNMIISGGTSTGKTTLVSILSTFIPREERIITIENVPELELSNRRHWIRLVAKSANVEGRGEIPLRALVKNALRMRPDRIILGEARGEEALDVVQAMHTGHDGFLTVLHANNPRAALERLETLMLMSGLELPPQACRAQIASAADLVVHLTRFADGQRGISSITQVLGASSEGFHLEDLFTFELQEPATVGHGVLRYTGVRPKFLQKFQLNHVPIPEWITV